MKTSTRAIALIVIAIASARVASAQTVEWAWEMSAYSSHFSADAFSAWQVLGEPNSMPPGGSSPYAWRVAADFVGNERPDTAFIRVFYRRPMRIRQVAIAENANPGAVIRVTVFDTLGVGHQVYEAKPAAADVPSRMLTITFPLTDYRVDEVQVDTDPGAVDGWNEIDAIGISESNEPLKAKINLAGEMDFTEPAENLGEAINTPFTDVFPRISPDGTTLYFSRKNYPGNTGGRLDNDDIWVSHFTDGHWTTAENLGPPLNTVNSNYVSSISPDGNTLLVGNIYLPDGSVAGGVSVTHRTDTGWSHPAALVIRNFYNYSRYSEYALANSGTAMILAIARRDSYGRRDLYVSHLRNGEWSEPENLSDEINSVGDEATPFLASDGRTLYFSTDGRSGYGGSDIFVSRRLDDTWHHWSKPQNLGPRINSAGWDAYFTVSAAGDYACFVTEDSTTLASGDTTGASASDGFGGEDIYRIRLPKVLGPRPVVLLAGRVYNERTGEPIEAQLRYEAVGAGDTGVARSGPTDGSYRITVAGGTTYRVTARANGFAAASSDVRVDRSDEFRQQTLDLPMTPLETGSIVRLKTILFQTGTAELKPVSRDELDRVVTMLQENPDVSIRIMGHTDDVGSADANRQLSEERARNVAEYIASHGIDRSRLSAEGFGESRPVASNATGDGRQKNRRVEFEVLRGQPESSR